MPDEQHDGELTVDDKDTNSYVRGKIQDHFVVVVCFPAGKVSTDTAASVVSNMQRSFRNVKFGLMVGVGGGIPTVSNDIRLGDVVVSQHEGDYGGVVYYDKGKITESGFEGK